MYDEFLSVACVLYPMRKPHPVLGAVMMHDMQGTIRLICEYREGRLAPEVSIGFKCHLGIALLPHRFRRPAALTLEVLTSTGKYESQDTLTPRA